MDLTDDDVVTYRPIRCGMDAEVITTGLVDTT